MRKLITTILTIIAVSACRPELSFLPESFHSPDAEISGDENAVSLVFSPKAGTASLSLESGRLAERLLLVPDPGAHRALHASGLYRGNLPVLHP